MWGGKKKRREQWGTSSSDYSSSGDDLKSRIKACQNEINSRGFFDYSSGSAVYIHGVMSVSVGKYFTDYEEVREICAYYGFNCEFR